MPTITTLTETLLQQVQSLKTQLDQKAYRSLCEALSCQLGYEVYECDFGDVDPRTGHPRACWCKECYTELLGVETVWVAGGFNITLGTMTLGDCRVFFSNMR